VVISSGEAVTTEIGRGRWDSTAQPSTTRRRTSYGRTRTSVTRSDLINTVALARWSGTGIKCGTVWNGFLRDRSE